jgi:hypothetical protein
MKKSIEENGENIMHIGNLKNLFFSLLLLLTVVPSLQAKEFLLLYANDQRGEVAPCG